MSLGDLSPEELRKTFDKRIRPTLTSAHQDGHAATIHVVGAQPGAGKSRVIGALAQSFPGAVPVIGDDFRPAHPRYEDLMRDDPLAMPAVTAQASGVWVGMALEYLRNTQTEILLETTMRQATVVNATLRDFKTAGYRTELHVLAVPPELSRLGTLTRYTGQVEDVGAGRWTPGKMHDIAAAAVPETLDAVLDAQLLSRVVICDRQANVLFEADPEPGNWQQVSAAAQEALREGRETTSLSELDRQDWAIQLAKDLEVCARTGQTDPDLIRTMRHLVEVDAPAVTRHLPQDEQRNLLANIRTAANDIPGLGANSVRKASFPTPPRAQERSGEQVPPTSVMEDHLAAQIRRARGRDRGSGTPER
ncbi:zeta toxin family protein [Mumia sp. zg.B17]|uniref:zeta toxin family protein n=1 Tax=Mumia sp. zg.B17 TaxID=2855446 RepID=UPI001C6E0314|nr:zeta toxin family protein [Mumia sp. zg.B17]MBW9207969.1 zeta toxin family protein [Mumia sp. zg.B17]